ncbi:MAG: hypothetical protein M1812_000250 [Candelaria pacifica]|nr:MAG: hypothetical protein M1812_000250 [Candelaria pacifica]
MSGSNNLAPVYTSPKRKRDELEPSYSSPRNASRSSTPNVDTSTHYQLSNLLTNEGSPRAAVSNQFEGLKLEGGSISRINFGGEGDTDIASKRLKSNHGESQGFMDIQVVSGSTIDGYVSSMEIPETPDRGGESAVSQKIHNEISSRHNETSSRQNLDTTDDALPTAAAPTEARTRETATPPLNPRELSPDPDSLTWREEEITGHKPDDPDDDGYGLNCVGFKPTPAIAYARTQHRKQQILDWKTREGREARQKRSERRRGGVEANKAETLCKTEEGRRKVRFREEHT